MEAAKSAAEEIIHIFRRVSARGGGTRRDTPKSARGAPKESPRRAQGEPEGAMVHWAGPAYAVTKLLRTKLLKI